MPKRRRACARGDSEDRGVNARPGVDVGEDGSAGHLLEGAVAVPVIEIGRRAPLEALVEADRGTRSKQTEAKGAALRCKPQDLRVGQHRHLDRDDWALEYGIAAVARPGAEREVACSRIAVREPVGVTDREPTRGSSIPPNPLQLGGPFGLSCCSDLAIAEVFKPQRPAEAKSFDRELRRAVRYASGVLGGKGRGVGPGRHPSGIKRSRVRAQADSPRQCPKLLQRRAPRDPVRLELDRSAREHRDREGAWGNSLRDRGVCRDPGAWR